jgi:hypothetical protein
MPGAEYSLSADIQLIKTGLIHRSDGGCSKVLTASAVLPGELGSRVCLGRA